MSYDNDWPFLAFANDLIVLRSILMYRTGLLIGFCLFPVVLAAAEEDRVQLVITGIMVNHQEISPMSWNEALDHPEHPLELAGGQSLRITYKQVPKEGKRPIRLRHRLEGIDPEWQESVGRIRMTANIVDRYQIPRASRTVMMSGDSPGWDGHLETAPLTTYRMQLMVPPEGRSCDLSFTSEDAGGALIGWGALATITATVLPKDGSTPRIINLERQKNPPVWVQVRTSAWWQAKPVQRSDVNDSLGLLDERSDAFASWRLQDDMQPAVKTGDQVQITWKACHSLGRGGVENLNYGPLASGFYLLRLGGRGPDGQILPGELRLAVHILPPWWERPIWWALVTASAVVAAAIFTRQRWQRQLAAAEQRTALEQERARIARDLHDELGTNLAQISMLGSLARMAATEELPEVGDQIERIMERASEGSRKLREIVWAVNPVHDSVEPLALFLCAQAEEHLRLAGVRFRAEIPDDLPEQLVSSTLRHHLVLAVREALHNAVRHGRPDCVILRLKVQDGRLIVEIEDNGVGCDSATAVAAGRGIAQLYQRLKELSGTCQFTSTSGVGTTVRFNVPCPKFSR